MNGVWYFAYGSNMQTATFRGRRGISYLRAVPGCARGWRLVVDKPPLIPIGESFASVIADSSAETFGVIYEISSDDLAHIDLTEGVLLGNYHRIEIEVRPLAPDSTPHPAFTLTSERRDPTLQPSTRYMRLLIAGAIEHSLPEEYVAYLRSIPACEESARAAVLRPLVDQFLRRPQGS